MDSEKHFSMQLLCSGTSTIVGYWNLIAREVVPADLSLLKTAKLLAHLNVASYDAQVSAISVVHSL